MLKFHTAVALATVAVVAVPPAHTSGQGPLGTAFTYQGELRQGGNPGSGLFDMRFRLYDAPSGGTQQGAVVCLDDVVVATGKFTISLDFGAQYNGQRRYLEIEVRPDSGADCNISSGFVLLTPRQELTAVPHAMYAISSVNALEFNGQPASFYQNASNLVSGTIPSARFSGTYANAVALTHVGNQFTGSGAGLHSLNASGIATGTLADTVLSSNVPRLNQANAFGAFTNTFQGNVGVGTVSPAVPLHVRGEEAVRIQGNLVGASNMAYLSFHDVSGNSIGYIGDGSSGDTSVFLHSETGDVVLSGQRHLVVRQNGDVGVGTTTPAARLDVVTTAPAVVRATTSSSNTSAVAVLGTLTHNGSGGLMAAGVKGVHNGITGGGAGVWGHHNSNGRGVWGEAVSGTGVFGRLSHGTIDTGYGVYGSANTNSYAVYADGRFAASGTKSFRIDHPLDPANKYLMHYCAEGPEPLNLYTGTVVTNDAGEAWVELPGYFASINAEPRYMLTVIDDDDSPRFVHAKVTRRIADGRFKIRTSEPGVEVAWVVIASRSDGFVQTYGAPVEVVKPDAERGRYLNPELHGQPESMRLHPLNLNEQDQR